MFQRTTILLLLLVLVLAACGGSDSDDNGGGNDGEDDQNTSQTDGGASEELEISETTISGLLRRLLAARGANPLLRRVSGVEIQDGIAVISGGYMTTEGSQEGGFSVSFTVEDGAIVPVLSDIDLGEGVTADDERLVAFNDALVRSLLREFPEDVEPIIVTASLSSDGLKIGYNES